MFFPKCVLLAASLMTAVIASSESSKLAGSSGVVSKGNNANIYMPATPATVPDIEALQTPPAHHKRFEALYDDGKGGFITSTMTGTLPSDYPATTKTKTRSKKTSTHHTGPKARTYHLGPEN